MHVIFFRKSHLDGGEKLTIKNAELEIAFVDKEGRIYKLTDVNSAELSKGFEKISKEIATRLRLQKEQR